MEKTEIMEMIKPFVKELKENTVESCLLYAFKSKGLRNNENPLITMEYEFFRTGMPKDKIRNATESILGLFTDLHLSGDSDYVFSKYTIENPKKVIDYLELEQLDFNDRDTLNGSKEDLDANNYKIQWLLNRLEENCRIPSGESDYIKFKHSAIKVTLEDESELIILNKVAPIFKPKGILFMVNCDPEEVEYTPIDKMLFKLPLYPHVIIVDNKCFFIEPDVESIFGFEKYNKKLCEDTLKLIKDKNIMSEESFELVSKYSKKGRNYNGYVNFKKERLDILTNRESKEFKFLRDELKIEESEGKLKISDEVKAKSIVDFLCNYLFKDVISEKLVEAINVKEIEQV